MAEDSDLDKTEDPSERRLSQAREQGQVPHSRELGTFLVLLVAASTLWMMGHWFLDRTLTSIKFGFTVDPKFFKNPLLMQTRLADLSLDALITFAPFFLALMVAAVLPPFFLNAWIFSPKGIVPDLNRLNPLTGFGRMFSWNSLVELGKAILKAILVGSVAAMLIWKEKQEIIGLIAEPLDSAIGHAGQLIIFSFLLMVATLIVVVGADVPFQLWQHFNQLKMTKEEVKQEMKEMMGDPHVKGRIRSLQMQAARKRMMSAVPKANVVVTNPTHYAVALSYQSGMNAPKIVAMGTGVIAQKIKALAAEHGVPLLEAPPLARSLYKHGNLDTEIPGGLYSAVAEVLAYLHQLSEWKQIGGRYPTPPQAYDIPPELVPEAN